MKLIIDTRQKQNLSSGKGQYIAHLLKFIQQGHSIKIEQIQNTPFLYLKNWLRLFFSKNYDLFFSPTSFILPALGIQKSIITVHDLACFRLPKTLQWKTLFLEKLFLKLALKNAQAIIVPSQAVKKDLLFYCKNIATKKVFVVYEGVNKAN